MPHAAVAHVDEWSSSVLSVMPDVEHRMPSRRSSSQSPPGDGSTVRVSSSPSKVPPVTVADAAAGATASPTSVKFGVDRQAQREEVRGAQVGAVMCRLKSSRVRPAQ